MSILLAFIHIFVYNVGWMNIGIYYNVSQADRPIAEGLARKIEKCGSHAAVFTSLDDVKEIDRLIVLGGDGTVLRAARCAAQMQIPLAGVNFGRLGFLTEFERGDADKIVPLVLDENCQTLPRTMLEVDFNGNKTYCLNEVSLLRGVAKDSDNRAAKISVTIDGSGAGTFTADGLIVTTPTGSTAYSLSAGGSIMTPECGTFGLTPVCAFSLKSRPIAYPDKYELKFILPSTGKLVLCGDGTFLGEAGAEDEITVRKADRTAVFLTRDKHDCFRRLTEKLN